MCHAVNEVVLKLKWNACKVSRYWWQFSLHILCLSLRALVTLIGQGHTLLMMGTLTFLTSLGTSSWYTRVAHKAYFSLCCGFLNTGNKINLVKGVTFKLVPLI